MTKENLKRMYELLKDKPKYKKAVDSMLKKYPTLLDKKVDPKPTTESKETKKSNKEIKE